MHIDVLPVWECRILWNWNYQQLWATIWMLGIKPRSFGKAAVFLTFEPSLHPWTMSFIGVTYRSMGEGLHKGAKMTQRQLYHHSLPQHGWQLIKARKPGTHCLQAASVLRIVLSRCLSWSPSPPVSWSGLGVFFTAQLLPRPRKSAQLQILFNISWNYCFSPSYLKELFLWEGVFQEQRKLYKTKRRERDAEKGEGVQKQKWHATWKWKKWK